MKIVGYSSIKNAAASKAKKDSSASSTSFLDFLTGGEPASDVEPTASVEGAAPASMLDAMLSLQEVPEEEVRRKKEVQRGKTTIDTLEQLRHGLLMGKVPTHILTNLSQLLKVQREQVSDPRLIEIMDDIELRAAVEVAKLEMSQQLKA